MDQPPEIDLFSVPAVMLPVLRVDRLYQLLIGSIHKQNPKACHVAEEKPPVDAVCSGQL